MAQSEEIQRLHNEIHGGEETATTIELPVYGMTCRGCAGTIEAGLQAITGVRSVQADVVGKRVIVTGDPSVTRRETLTEAVESMGFSITSQKTDPGRAVWKKAVLFLTVALAIVAVGTYAFQKAQAFYLSGGTIQNLNELFGQVSLLALGLAFLFGLVVAFSPASYALAPAIMGYVSGAKRSSWRESLKLSSAFVAGIATVDMAVGALFAAGGAAAIFVFSGKLPLWYAIVTVVLFALALMTLGVWKVNLPVLRPQWREARSARGAYLLGIPFGLIACPACTPLLLPVALGAAATGQAWYGAALMGAFALGRGLPLVTLGASTGAFQSLKGFTQYIPWIEKAVGILLLAGALWFLREFFRVSQAFGLF